MIVGLDSGNATTIAYDGERTVVFPSVTGGGTLTVYEQVRQQSPAAERGEFVLEHDGVSCFVGELALRDGTAPTAAAGDNHRYWSGHTLRLALVALSQIVPDGGMVQVVTGLPFQLWCNQDNQRRVITSLRGTHTCTINGAPYSVTIENAVVFAESAAATFVLPAPVGMPRAVLDIGARTTDGYISNGVPDIQRCFSASLGVQDVGIQFARAVIDGTGRELSPHEVSRILDAASAEHELPALVHRGRPLDVSVQLAAARWEIGRRILEVARQRWATSLVAQDIAADAAQVDIIGGGAHMFGAQMTEAIPHARIADDPATVNARGFYEIGVQKWQQHAA